MLTCSGRIHPRLWLGLAAALLTCAPALTQGVSNATLSTASLPAMVPEPAAIPTNLQPDLVLPAVPDTFILGDGDLLSIFVYQMPEFTRQIRIDDRGTIRLPFLASSLEASGKTPPALAGEIAADLTTAGLARQPRVQVAVRQVESRPVIVSGEVRNPGVLQAVHPITLVEALARAGGLTTAAGSTVTITRPTPSPGQSDAVVTIPTEAILNPTAGEPPMLLTGGESVRVMAAEMIYAVGALNQPGGFPLQPGQPLTALRAVALAHGFANYADRSHALILNEHLTQPPQPIDLAAVAKGKIPDPILQPGQVVFVPDSTRSKGLAAALADAGQALVLAIAYGKF